MNGTFIARLRSRPKHERRMLATITYLAASAAVLALWANSFRAVIAPAQIAFENAPAAPESGEAPPPQLAQLTTPFETLREGIKNIAAGFRDISRGNASPAATNETPIAASAAPPAEAPVPAASAAALKPVPKPNSADARSPGLGEVLAQIKGEPDHARTAESIAAPAGQTESSASRGLGQELIRLAGNGLASLGEAITALYALLTN